MSIFKKVQEHGGYLVKKLVNGRNKGVILCYHRVLPQALITNYGPNTGLIVPEAQFEQHMHHLASTCDPMTLNQIIDRSTFKFKRPVAVTFDDGTADNLTYALPILEKYCIPATIYITTGFVLRQLRPWWDLLWTSISITEKYKLEGEKLDWETSTYAEKIKCFKQIHGLMLSGNAKRYQRINSELHAKNLSISTIDRFLTSNEVAYLSKHPLITIGLHTHSHTPTSFLSDQEFKDEMAISTTFLNQWTMRESVHFAYPYGTRAMICNRAGYLKSTQFLQSASTTIPGLAERQNRYELPRISIPYSMRMPHFRAVVGRYLL